nr:BamA/TamA family outer membrane protein [Polymorphobacter sp.]
MIVCSAGARAALAVGGCCAGLGWAGVVVAQGVVVAPAGVPDLLAPRPGITVPWPDAAAAPGAAVADAVTSGDVRYTVALAGLDDRLAPRFRTESALFKGRGAVANLAQINRRAADDRDLIDLLLRSLGYYGGRTVTTIVAGTAGAPVAVTLTVDEGPLYHVAEVRLVTPPGTPEGLVEGGIGIKAGDPLGAAAIAAGQDGLKAYLATRGHPFATIEPPEIEVDHATRTATLTQHVDPGAAGRFGRIRVDGKSVVGQAGIERLARWHPGDPYTAADLDDLRRALIATGLVGGVTLAPVAAGRTADGGETIDVVVHTDTAPLRTVAATGGYSTSQGARLEASWEHRNLLPPNGAVTFRAIAAEHEQLLGAELRRQNWRSRDTTLVFDVFGDSATQDAFNARTIQVGATIERETNLIWQKQWYYSLGTQALISIERDKSAPGNPLKTYYIAATPASLTYDGSNNLLDPTRGFRLTGRASPELSFASGTFPYVKLQVEATKYVPLSDRITFAARGHLGTIAGASKGDIAPSRRFYAGGGGSVRGYGYQGVGPKDVDGSPRGGDSIAEASVEARFRFGDFGVVPFFDAGEIDTATIPRFRDVRYGAGIGARYYTSFGPVRIDVATPINPQKGDARVQFYVSIGQAF